MLCQKEFKGLFGLVQHCSQIHSPFRKKRKHLGHPKGVIAWNKGLTKETDPRVKDNSESTAATIRKLVKQDKWIPGKMSEKARLDLSKRQSLHNTGGKSKWYTMDGSKVQGTWERNIAQKFCELGIKWIKLKLNKDIWKYKMGGKLRSYTPDFYLPDYDIYLEIKGFWWFDDKNKMKQVLRQHRDKKLRIIEWKDYKRILSGELVWL